jgi:hypothetical protein
MDDRCPDVCVDVAGIALDRLLKTLQCIVVPPASVRCNSAEKRTNRVAPKGIRPIEGG